MFRISKTNLQQPSDFSFSVNEPAGHKQLQQFCSSENWTGDLANGLFQIGNIASYFHGLEAGECGLLTLLRCYEANDRVHILELLEDASAAPASFCFSTFIIGGPEDRQPVMCIGESSGFDDTVQGSMRGVFIFPRILTSSKGTH